MGINTTIIIVKPLGDKELNTTEILKGLRVPAAVEQEDLDFENTLSRLTAAYPAEVLQNSESLRIRRYRRPAGI